MDNGTTNFQKMFASGLPVVELPDHIRSSNLPTMAALSIRAGLQAYFSTYKLVGVSSDTPTDIQEPVMRLENAPDYLQAYTETVLHLHFGIELAIKHILRNKHELLASDRLPSSAVLLCRLLSNDQFSFDQAEQLRSIEFSEALKRTNELVTHGYLNGMSILIENEDLLKELNKLRNRIIHRGLFVLNYSALDVIVATHLIPFLSKFLTLSQFESTSSPSVLSTHGHPWDFRKLACGIDPIEEIVKLPKLFGDQDIRKKLALLKELGRASYENPLHDSDLLAFDNAATTFQAELAAGNEMGNLNPHALERANGLLKCPVCGEMTLVRYHDIEGSDTQVKCSCCSFKVQRSLGNLSDYGYSFGDFWA